jgi:hypothetical protein
MDRPSNDPAIGRKCSRCGQYLTVSGEAVDPDPFLGEPQHVFCDLCGLVEHPADLTPDWNGETGCHLSCELKEARMEISNLIKPLEDWAHHNSYVIETEAKAGKPGLWIVRLRRISGRQVFEGSCPGGTLDDYLTALDEAVGKAKAWSGRHAGKEAAIAR